MMTRRSRSKHSDTVVVQVAEDDAAEATKFETASLGTRLFICLNRSIEAKKLCLLILVVALILVVQLIQLVAPPDFLASKSGQELIAAAKHWTSVAGELANISNRLAGG
jgi:hypothetical protein